MKNILGACFIIFSFNVLAQTAVGSDTIQIRLGKKLDCLREKALLIMDNKRFPCDSLKYLRPEDIEEIEVLNAKDATRLYGNVSGAYGAIIFTTKKYAALHIRKKEAESGDTKKP